MIIDSKAEINYMYDILDKEGYRFNEYNPFGIRNFARLPNGIYNDSIGLLSEKFIYLCKGTTDPSPYYIVEHPMNAVGTAVLDEGLHDRIWMVGIHAKRVVALINGWRGTHCTKKQRVKRIGKDYKFKPKLYRGWYCCNMHPKFDNDDSYIGKNSAGCQVVMVVKEFHKYMNYIISSKEFMSNKRVLYSYYIFMQNRIISDVMGWL